ncbi:helix-turn-helix protein [Streptomyces sp. 2333.5]|uniref:XRE family transcriptional regulator n=1 Tax=unclassified Streptomyces TaxID=2593676 RepID=UPI00089CE03C|nr:MULTISPECIES: XRE family transcriptional regulator [unclassified Streptomyces]PJI99820.1 helix-turn-helix protein [Streptomyces sp. 2333.5]SEB60548.1 Helix-turn-helix domain-containing protein [Streptomyces sp. 2314.4]
MPDEQPPDPRRARTPAEFVLVMRAMKDRSGLTYRQLAVRAEGRGDVLPASTLAGTLSRGSLPRPEVVEAFVRACGGSPDDVERWLGAHHDLTHGDPHATTPEDTSVVGDTDASRAHEGPPFPEDGKDSGPRWSAHARLFGGASLALLALVGVSLAVTRLTGQETAPAQVTGAASTSATPRPALSGPPPGVYRIRSAASSLCLSEREGESGGRVYQAACAKAVPVYSVEPVEGGAYRIRSLHPVFGYGCLGVTGGSTRAGAQLMDDYCGHRGSAERFQLQPADHARYRLVPAHTGACASVPGGSSTEWTPVVQLACRPDDPGQLFLFDSHPPPTAVPSITSN